MSLTATALAAGALAAVNPCGFVLLPALLGRFATRASGPAGPLAGLRLGLFLTLGLLAVFGAIGLLIGAAGHVLGRYFPHAGLVVAAGLVMAGVAGLAGRGPRLGLAVRAPSGDGPAAFFAFGAAYGLASLGCALAEFLVVAGLALSGGPLPAVLALGAYGLGMGLVLTVLSVAAGLGRAAVQRWLRQASPYVEPVGSGLLVLAGAYLVSYNLGFLLFDFEAGNRIALLVGALGLALGLGLRLLGERRSRAALGASRA